MSAPFMQLYVGDYLRDTRHLTAEQHGAYLLLLMAMWNADGTLPNDHKKLARLASCTPTRWSKISADVMAFFEVDGDTVTNRHIQRWSREKRRQDGRQSMPAALRAMVIERDGFRCVYCGQEDGPFEVDHVVPVSKGGGDHPENLCCACRACNRSKGAKLLEDWCAS